MSSSSATDEEPGVRHYTARATGRRLFQGTREEFQEWKDRCYQEAALEFEGGDDGASQAHDFGSAVTAAATPVTQPPAAPVPPPIPSTPHRGYRTLAHALAHWPSLGAMWNALLPRH